MKQLVFTAPCVTELLEVDIPEIKENEVLVRIERSSISAGTERANLVGDPSVSGASAPKVKFPRKVGYSSSGVVVKVGSAVTRVRVGDRVACMDSKHAQYWNMSETKVFPLPDSVSMGAAALTYISIFPLAAVRKCRVEIGESAMVMGQGVLGQIAVQILRAAGATPIIAVDPVEKKREQALTLGADYALDPFAPDFAKTVKELTRGGANVCIEVTGKGQGLDMALDCMARFGRVALLGCTRDSNFTIDYYRKVHFPGISLIGAHTNARPSKESHDGWWTALDDSEAIVRLLATGRLNFDCLIEEVHPASEGVAVFERLAKEPSFPVVQFDWTQM